jgi:L-alanine-DL-glutamate epimerase-like enolase superfamily enzyme
MSATTDAGTEVPVRSARATAYTIPTDSPEADGTLEWSSTTIVIVVIDAGGKSGIGWTYADAAAAQLVNDTLAGLLEGQDAQSPPAVSAHIRRALRNAGWPGLGAMAASAVDVALWDLRAKLVDLPLFAVLGAVRTEVPVYGSGGFTSYSNDRLADQLAGWVAEGIPRVKMKVGSRPTLDPSRVQAARAAIGDAALFVDANGAYTVPQALKLAEAFAASDVSWFEEPVSSDDLAGLASLRHRLPPGMALAAGEYGWDARYFARMAECGAVDVLQADATRCGGMTGFMQAAAVATAHQLPLSSHCAPALHLHPGLAAASLVHAEWFHDHVRVEQLLFDGAPGIQEGAMAADRSRPGLGVDLKTADAERYRR